MGEVLALYRGRIMRAAFLLAHPGNRGLADSLEAVVAQVVTTHMLLFAAGDKLVLQLSLVRTLNTAAAPGVELWQLGKPALLCCTDSSLP